MNLLFVLTVAAFAFTNESEAAFKDLPEDNYFSPYVYDLVERRQHPDGTFRTNAPVTRAEASHMLSKYSGRYYPMEKAIAYYEELYPNEIADYYGFSLYPDIQKNTWYYNAVYSLASDGIVSGFPDGHFYPNSFLTRGEAAKIIRGMVLDARALKSHNTFIDIEGHFAEQDIRLLASYGLFLGKDGRKFAPNDPVTRGELAIMIYRLNAYQDLIMAGETVEVKEIFLMYNFEWLNQYFEQGNGDGPQQVVLVQGKDMAAFLNDGPYEGAYETGFIADESKNYIVKHFSDGNCSSTIKKAKFSLNSLIVSESSFGYQSKLQYGEELLCTLEVIYGLEILEVPANMPVTEILKIQFPYRLDSYMQPIDVIPYKGASNELNLEEVTS